VKSSKRPLPERTRDTTEGALLAALTALVGLLILFFGQLGLVAAPLPLFVLTYRRGPRIAGLSAVVAGLVLSPLIGFPGGLLLVAAFAPMGILQGVVARADRPGGPTKAVAFGLMAGICSVMLGLVVARIVTNIDPIAASIEAQVKALEWSAGMARSMNLPASQIQQLEQLSVRLPDLARLLLPGMLLLSTLLWSYGSYTLARAIMGRLGVTLPGFSPILTWRLSLLWGIFLIAPMMLGIAIQGAAPQIATVLVGNAFILSVVTFAFFGVLTMLTYLHSRGVPKSGRVLSVIAVFALEDPGLFLMALLGAIDLWFDLRKVGPRAVSLKESVEES